MKKYIWVGLSLITLLVLGGAVRFWNTRISSNELILTDPPIRMQLAPGRTIDEAPSKKDGIVSFRFTTPEVDTAGYPVLIQGTVQPESLTPEEAAHLYQTAITTSGETFAIACDGIAPAACQGINIDDHIYVLGLGATSLQPLDPNTPSSFAVKDYDALDATITTVLNSLEIYP